MNFKSSFLALSIFASLFYPAKNEAYYNNYNKPATYLNVNHPVPFVGMFSVFCYVAGVLYEYDTNQYAGMRINFGNRGLYYDPQHGENWWTYFCEPIETRAQGEVRLEKSFDENEYCHYAYLTELQLPRNVVHHLIEKYIKIKPFILDKVNDFVAKNFDDHFTLGIHYRGTDKSAEAPRISYEHVANIARDYLNQNGIYTYKIFVATDEQAFVDYMIHTFGEKVITYDVVRASDYRPLHFHHKTSSYDMGEQAMIDCLLLSKTHTMLRTSSNLSLWSGYFNPDLNVIEMTNRTSVLK